METSFTYYDLGEGVSLFRGHIAGGRLRFLICILGSVSYFIFKKKTIGRRVTKIVSFAVAGGTSFLFIFISFIALKSKFSAFKIVNLFSNFLRHALPT